MIAREIINKSIDYILNHLDENLTVSDVAEQFHFSEYYFNRQFKKLTGESVYSFIKRQKLNQGAMEIKQKKNKSITDIAQKYGYSSSNFSSAFKNIKKKSPAEFRNSANSLSRDNPFHPQRIEHFDTYEVYDKKISIKKFEDINVIYQRFIGNYNDLKQAWYHFMDIHEEELKEDTMMIEKFYDDPKVTEVNKCICDLCIKTHKAVDSDKSAVIKGGKFSVYRYEGKIEEIYAALQGIFSIWMPQSPYEMDKRYGLNIYHQVDRKNDFVVMDLCIPVK